MITVHSISSRGTLIIIGCAKSKKTCLWKAALSKWRRQVPFPVQKVQPSDSKEMMQLCFQGMQLDIPLSVSRDTLLMIIEVAAHAQ